MPRRRGAEHLAVFRHRAACDRIARLGQLRHEVFVREGIRLVFVAWETIKQKLLDIIGNEDKSNPLSDEDLVTKLSESGYPIKRRTVTKYRKMLGSPSSRQRKVWAE